MTKPKLYLDTSTISAHYDLQKPIRQLITQKWVENEIKNFDCYASTVVLKEIENNIDKELEFKMKDFIIINLFPL